MITELKEQRNGLIAQANAILVSAKGNMNAEQSAKFDAIYADVDLLAKNIERAERAAAAEAENRSTVRPPAEPIGPAATAAESAAAKLEARVAAFNTYIRRGARKLTDMEERALSDTTGSQGGYLIPQGFSNKLELATKWYGGMRQTASSYKTATGNTLLWPSNNDTSNAGEFLNLATTPGTVDPQDTSFATVTFQAFTVSSKYIAVPNELLQDSYFDLPTFLADKFNERIGRIENTSFTTGNGTNQASGLIPGSTVGVTAATGGTVTITYNNLVDTLHSVDISYRTGAKWMFHDSTLQIIRKIVDNYGHPLLGPGLNGAVPDEILGFKYQVNNDMAVAAANAQTIAFGALDKYMIRDVEGIEVMR
jgi:HK97 family phage major capsid protein